MSAIEADQDRAQIGSERANSGYGKRSEQELWKSKVAESTEKWSGAKSPPPPPRVGTAKEQREMFDDIAHFN
jgi:hypothetical protein